MRVDGGEKSKGEILEGGGDETGSIGWKMRLEKKNKRRCVQDMIC